MNPAYRYLTNLTSPFFRSPHTPVKWGETRAKPASLRTEEADQRSLRALDAAVLGQALRDLRSGPSEDAKEAAEWFLGAFPSHLFSFPRISQRAGLRPKGVREGVREVFRKLPWKRILFLRSTYSLPLEAERFLS